MKAQVGKLRSEKESLELKIVQLSEGGAPDASKIDLTKHLAELQETLGKIKGGKGAKQSVNDVKDQITE